ncbi:P-loop containing nucleoside triphosphate hydrolase protein [Scenedesmus sp. NREL 46B-D3]|nr:P-loop containing nucleoside triphosphate hydrolase protein [Scenedesmus sp. NREL 46B-D3]
MLAQRCLHAAWHGGSLHAAPTTMVRLARMACRPSLDRLLQQQQQQQHLQPARLGVACAAGLQIGKPYTAPASKPVSFDEMGLIPTLMDALRAAEFSKPTEIQSMSVPAILSGGDFLLCSQTGSGKTMAYLLPIVHMLKQREGEEGYVRRAKRPKVVVLGPTKELTEQIASVAKSLCHHAKFRAVCCNANTGMSAQAQRMAGPVDMLVATPQRLLQHQEAGNVALGDVQWLVIDEADTMFDQGFGEDVTKLLGMLRNKQPPVQVVLVSATMTKAVKRLADAQLPNLLRLEASGFHRPTAGARQEFRVLPPGGDKLQMLLELLQADVAKRRKVLVFCGSLDSCRAVEHSCADRDLPTVCYHGDMPLAARKESMALFAGSALVPDADAPSIMVATDLAARGLDFPGSIDHVINFDFPGNAIDYLHRSGRTARAGAKGLVTSLVGPRDRRLATAIQYAVDKGLPLDQVTASGAQPTAAAAGQRGARPSQHPQQKGPQGGAELQLVRWNPDHKFLHLRNGEPVVPFKDLLQGKAGEERKKLLHEIAMDVREWRRWRHARAAAKAGKRREKEAQVVAAGKKAPRQHQETPEERWKQKAAKKRNKGASTWGERGSGGRRNSR